MTKSNQHKQKSTFSKELIDIVLKNIEVQGGIISVNSFNGVTNYFKDMIFSGAFNHNMPYDSISRFTTEFKAKLKQRIYYEYPHLKNVVENKINDLIVKLENNTEIFVKSHRQRQAKLSKLFMKIEKATIKPPSPKVRINQYAKLLYQQMAKNSLKPYNLDDILLVNKSIDTLVELLLTKDKIFTYNHNISSEEKQKLISECAFKLRQQVEKRKQNYHSHISLLQKKNEEKIAQKQDRYEATIVNFVEELINECKLRDLYSYKDLTQFVVEKLRAKNIFTYKSVNIIAPKILLELQKQPDIFPEM